MTSHTCPNYELISISQRNRVLLTVDMAELPMGFPETIASAKFDRDHLVLECADKDGTRFELRFPDVPDLDAVRLQRFKSSLCAMNRQGRVELAKMFPAPALAPRIRMG